MRAFLGGVVAATLSLGVVADAQATALRVVNTNDSGLGSLRAAVARANATAGHDTIAFEIPGAGPHRITLETALPVISDPVTIDGLTQDGAAPPTVSAPATLQVELDAGRTAIGLDLQADDSHLTGLVVNGADWTVGGCHHIRIAGDRNRVTASHVGTDAAGTAPVGANCTGIEIAGAANRVGGRRASAT